MAEPVSSSVEQRLKNLATAGTAAAALGTALLQGAGYVSTRFHLRALGVDASVSLLDERFLFEGANFLIYVLATLPVILLVLLPLAALAWPLRQHLRGLCDRIATHLTPQRVALFAVVWAVLAIQLVMRQAYDLRHLLLQPTCQPHWLYAVLLDEIGILGQLFFAGLELLTLPTLAALVHLWHRRLEPGIPSALTLVTALALVQLLLLPVNFGALSAGSDLPRILKLPEEPATSRVWQVWESKERPAFLVVRPGEPRVRRLVFIPADDLGHLEVLSHDDVLQVLDRENPCAP